MTQITELSHHPPPYTSEDFQNISAYKSTVLVLKMETSVSLLLITYFPDENIRQKQMHTLIFKVSNQKVLEIWLARLFMTESHEHFCFSKIMIFPWLRFTKWSEKCIIIHRKPYNL